MLHLLSLDVSKKLQNLSSKKLFEEVKMSQIDAKESQ